MTNLATDTDTRGALATIIGGALVRRNNDVNHAANAITYARVLRNSGADREHVARALRFAHDAIRWVREDAAIIADVSLCPCGSVYRCKCVAPF